MLLDVLAALGVASVGTYSLQKLRAAYAGACIRVRRSSDNAEQNFGFVGNLVNIPAVLAFVGAGDGFVVMWFDQSLAGNNITNAVAGAQPQCVIAGVFVTANGYPALNQRSANGLATADILGGTATNILASYVVSGVGFDVEFNVSAGPSGWVRAFEFGGTYFWDCGSDGGVDRLSGVAAAGGVKVIYTLTNNSAGKALYKDNVLLASNASQSVAVTNQFQFGGTSTNALHECIVFNSAAAAAQRPVVVTSQQARYP